MDDSYARARSYLATHNVLCLATTDQHGPWVSPVFYCIFKQSFAFLSAPHTRHCKNISTNPAVSASIQDDYKEWSEIKGIQLQGVARRVDKTDTKSVIQTYSDKFPVTGKNAPPEIANALDKVYWYQVLIEKLYFIDNSERLGHRVELVSNRVFSI